MSTRCNIILWGEEEEKPVFFKQVYHHSDGYLEGVGSDLAGLATQMMGEDDGDIQSFLDNLPTVSNNLLEVNIKVISNR